MLNILTLRCEIAWGIEYKVMQNSQENPENQRVYLNNATTTFPKSQAAIKAFQSTIQFIPSDIRHTSQPVIEVCRSKIGRLLNLDESHLYFTSDATLGINCITFGFLSENGHCLVDNRSHNALTRALFHRKTGDWEVGTLYDPDDETHLSHFLERMRDTTEMVCLTHTSNVTGSVYKLKPTIQAIRSKAPDVAILVDASQSAGIADLDVLQEADFAVFPGHKFLHALPGAAVLVAKRRLRPFVVGGTGTHSARMSLEDYNSNFVEVGTPNLPAIVSMAAAVEDWMAHKDTYRQTVTRNLRALWEGVQGISGVKVFGRSPDRNRSGILALEVANGDPEMEWATFLQSRDIIVRGGLHCCPAAHASIRRQTAGTVRLSVSRYTSRNDIDKALEALGDFSKIMSGVA